MMIAGFLKHGSNIVLLAALALAVGLAAGGAWQVRPGFVLLGALLFFLSEYGFHRFAFHAPPMRSVAILLRLQRRLHYDHHAKPDRLDLLFLPLWFLIPNLATTAAVTALIWP